MSFSLLNHSGIPNDIHLGLAKLSDQAGDAGQLTDVLDESEREEYEVIKNDRRRNEFFSTRYLVKSLANKFGLLEKGFTIKKDAMGKPFGEAGEQYVFLSIAHCHREVMCGLSESRDIGVDLEPVDRQVHEGLGSRIYHPEEHEQVRELDLIRVWTIKEALVKLDGKGLRTNLNELLLSWNDENDFSCRINDEKSARICSFEYDDHWVSVAFYVS